MQYWILKSEPATYSWETFLKEKKTFWNGVRNYQARNNLAKMKVGDLAFFYHSGEQRKIVGIAKVTAEAHPDNLTDDPRWVMVDVEPVKALTTPVELSLIKEITELQNIKLVRQSRLSVSELGKSEFELVLKLGKTSCGLK
jgi:predicted RNA-binding protein with PUA-like domain